MGHVPVRLLSAFNASSRLTSPDVETGWISKEGL